MFKRYRRNLIALTFVTLFSMAVVACGGSAADTATAADPSTSGPAASVVAPPLQESSAPSDSNAVPAAAVSLSTGDPAQPDTDPVPAAVVSPPSMDAVSPAPAMLDADAIVAAHEEVLADIYEAVLPSVVRIEVAQEISSVQGFRRFGDAPNVPEDDEFRTRGEGSGFVWSSEGHIVTNHHVIDGADRVTVIFADGSEYEADVLGSDPDSDLAVLKLESSSKQVSAVTLGDSDELRVGQLALAIGAPFGQEFTLTRGIVSALGRAIESGTGQFLNPEAIQTDAPINPGNSGGPLLDRRGRVIGINSQIISRSGSSSGIGFAVPIDTAKRVVPELIATGKYEYAYLGISGVTVRPRLTEAAGLPEGTRGVLVATLRQDGPAGKSGLRAGDEVLVVDGADFPVGGDIITAADGMAIATMPDLLAYLVENKRPGDVVALQVLRNGGETSEIEVTLEARPDPTDPTTRPS